MKYTFDETGYVYLHKKLVEFGQARPLQVIPGAPPGNKYAGQGTFRYLTFPDQEYMQDKNQRLPEGKRWALTEGREVHPIRAQPDQSR
ncbi:hypothetical protein ACWDA3_47725 [Nonomuraea rubra]